jgi:hypothetical protein
MRIRSVFAVASVLVASMAWSPATQVAASATGYVSLPVPARLLDTRPGTTTVDGHAIGAGVVEAGTVKEVKVGTRANIPVDAAAVVINVTAVDATGPSYASVYAGDKGFDDGENHELLRAKGKKSALVLNRYRTEKADVNQEVWRVLKASPAYRAGRKERYKIERKFGEAKQNHGLRRCRYLGWVRYALQAYLTVIVLNLKRMVKVLTGVSFKGEPLTAA